MNATTPLEHIYDLSDLSNAGAEVTVRANEAQRVALAKWLEANSVESFESTITLTKLAPNRFRYDAVLACDLTRPSVVTLEPLPSHIEERFSRELHVAHRTRHAPKDEELTFAAGDDDAPEEIQGHRYDLAAPLLEELSLALDPYPKAPGEVFAAEGTEEDRPESPFAVLKGLKKPG